jgi:hypothetical protein
MTTVQALGERWTRDASKHAAASQLAWTDELDGPARRWPDTDDPLVLAPGSPCELAVAGVSQELAHARELPDGLGIDP